LRGGWRPDRVEQELDIGGKQRVGIEMMVSLEQLAPEYGSEHRGE
jgi:hypothetical protein